MEAIGLVKNKRFVLSSKINGRILPQGLHLSEDLWGIAAAREATAQSSQNK